MDGPKKEHGKSTEQVHTLSRPPRGPKDRVHLIFPGLSNALCTAILEHRENALNYVGDWNETWIPFLWDASDGYYVVDCGRMDSEARSAPVFSWDPASVSAGFPEWYTSLTRMFCVMSVCFEEGAFFLEGIRLEQNDKAHERIVRRLDPDAAYWISR
jgi:hypothetical protein